MCLNLAHLSGLHFFCLWCRSAVKWLFPGSMVQYCRPLLSTLLSPMKALQLLRTSVESNTLSEAEFYAMLAVQEWLDDGGESRFQGLVSIETGCPKQASQRTPCQGPIIPHNFFCRIQYFTLLLLTIGLLLIYIDIMAEGNRLVKMWLTAVDSSCSPVWVFFQLCAFHRWTEICSIWLITIIFL